MKKFKGKIDKIKIGDFFYASADDSLEGLSLLESLRKISKKCINMDEDNDFIRIIDINKNEFEVVSCNLNYPDHQNENIKIMVYSKKQNHFEDSGYNWFTNFYLINHEDITFLKNLMIQEKTKKFFKKIKKIEKQFNYLNNQLSI